ncbi:MAG: alpha/beta hydrolase [Acidobacteriota bacterium]|nr:alpha/beta hydrolase [Acidobacteriota bacterium]
MPIDSDMQAVLDQFEKFQAPPIETLTPQNARNAPTLKNAVEEMAANSPTTRAMNVALPALPEPVGEIKHILIPSQNGEILARIYTPASGNAPHPVLVYFHGGGWVIANLDVYEPSCRALCNAAECIVVSVNYRQAPEAQYPAAVEDASAALQWVLQNAEQIGGDPMRIAVGGESAGGNLATVSCLLAREQGGQLPVAQLLVYPVTDMVNQDYQSYAENQNTKPLNTAMMSWFAKYYIPNEQQRSDPTASPLLANDLSGLPPAIVITAEFDPLRDQGEAYAQKLADAGVPVDSKLYDGVTHEFFGLAGTVSKAKEAVQQAADGLTKIWRGESASATSGV